MMSEDSYDHLLHDTLLFLHRLNPKTILFGTEEDSQFFQNEILSLKISQALITPASFLSKKLSSSYTSKPTVSPQKETIFPPQKKEDFSFTLEKPKLQQTSFTEIKEILSKIAPTLPLIDEPLSDGLAKEVHKKAHSRLDPQPINIISFQDNHTHLSFLKSLAKAIDMALGPTQLISGASLEKNNRWDLFLSNTKRRLIILSETTLRRLPHLFSFYSHFPKQKLHFLKEIPLFLLSDLTIYLKNPLLKRSLWKNLSHVIEEIGVQK